MADEESQPLFSGQEEARKLCPKGLVSTGLFVSALPTVVSGHLYLFDCQVQPFIPIFALVWGYGSILGCLLEVGMGCCWEDNMVCKIVRLWSFQLPFIMFVWVIVGSVWVYGVKKVDFEDITSVEYCNRNLYYFMESFIPLLFCIGFCNCFCESVWLLRHILRLFSLPE